MSGTRMDFSPQFINRKQNIASWPEGDIDQLATKDKKRYQKRKRAILDYFQSDLSVAEITERHRLSAADALEAMARRCCTPHEDGRPWGFRALVPGVKVVATGVPSSSSTLPKHTRVTEVETAASRRAKLFALEAERATQGTFVSAEANEDDDTVERAAIVLTKVTQLPQTPIPAALEDRNGSLAEPDDTAVKQEAFPALADEESTPAENAAQGASSTVPDGQTRIEDAAISQEKFPTLTDADPAGEESEEAEQAQLSTIEKGKDEEEQKAQEGVEELSLKTELEEQGEEEKSIDAPREEEDVESAEEKQLETSAQENTISLFEDHEVDDEDFGTEPTSKLTALTRDVEQELAETEALPAPELVPLAEGEDASAAVETPPAPELVAPQAQTSDERERTTEIEIEAKGNDLPETSDARGESEEAEIEETSQPEEVEETKQEPEMAEAAGEEAEANKVEEADGRVEGSEIEEKREAQPIEADLHREGSEVEEEKEAEEEKKSQPISEEDRPDEQDTAELARVVAEERLDRVVAVETIKVPAAMLDALEKADRELEARQEGATASTLSPETSSVTQVATASAATAEAAETQSSAAEVLNKNEVAEIPTQTLEARKRDSHSLTPSPVSEAPTRPHVEEGRYQITGSQLALKRSLLRRWGKKGRQQKYRSWMRIISSAILVSILVILLIPLGVGLVGYNAYTNIKNVANDGVNNLLTLKDLMPANKNDLLSALNTQKLATAKTNLQKAQDDFLQLQDIVNRPDVESLLQQFAPQYSNQLDMARHLVQVALDVSRMGQELVGVAQMGANVLHSSGSLLSSNSTQPLFSADDISTVEAALVHAQYYVNDIQGQMGQVDLAELPLGSASQKAELAKYLAQIPQAQSAITQAQGLVGPVAWMLGVGQTRRFLVQTLDRGELRPSGGFEGQYGILTLQNGRMSPFSLKDITGLDYASNGAELGALPPPQYSWMNFGNFGVRDANLSADFPTTAKIVMSYFQQEGGGPVDGVIQITPVIIKQFLQITGPLKVPEYHETITAQNLEDKLHQYQQDPRFISEQQQITGSDSKATRKAFTNLVGTLLMDRIKKLPPSQMVSFGKILLTDLKSRDLQVYLTNPVAEQWLTQNGYSGAMPRYTNGTDGFMVVQANISISKAAQYVKTTFKDDVTLDAQGGATHDLQIILNYQQTGPVYGYNTYANYMRIYAPANAQLISAYGFNTGSVLCTPGKPATKPTNGKGNGNGNGASSGGGSYTDAGVTISGCGQYYNTFPDTNARNCPDGDYRLGYDGMAARAWPVQNLGGPSAQSSDLPGYSMWAGLTLTPKNCITTISLSWYVPHVVQNTAGQAPYQMIVGHQAGWPDNAQISIDASALKGVKSLKYSQTIDVDTLVALAPRPLPPSQQKPGSTPTPAVTPTGAAKKP